MYCQNCLSRELRSELGINEQYSSTKVICKRMICKHCAKCNKSLINSVDFVSTHDIDYNIFLHIDCVIFIGVDLTAMGGIIKKLLKSYVIF